MSILKDLGVPVLKAGGMPAIEPGFTFDINTKTRRPIEGGKIAEF